MSEKGAQVPQWPKTSILFFGEAYRDDPDFELQGAEPKIMRKTDFGYNNLDFLLG